MPLLQRHSLVCLSAAGWAQVVAGAADAESRACLAHWAAHRLPLVATRQTDCRGHAAPQHTVALGLPAPACWSRRRIALQVPHASVLYTDTFPRMAAIAPLLPRPVRAAWSRLQQALDGPAQDTVQVYGSHGWQQMTGLAYLHAASDIDLLVRVDDAAAADRAAALLAGAGIDTPRLDGELVFPDGAAVAWREWQCWRRGDAAAILVKRRDGVALEADGAWLSAPSACTAGTPRSAPLPEQARALAR